MKNMKKWVAFLCVIALCCSLASCMLPSNNENKTTPNDSANTTPPTDQGNKNDIGEAATFVTLDINPSIELTVDANGIVVSVYGANEDGQILLYEEAEKIIHTYNGELSNENAIENAKIVYS